MARANGETGETLNAALARKASLEADLLAEQLTPEHKKREAIRVAAGASGLVLALISLVGGLFSVGGWFIDQRQNRELRIEERLDAALGQLSAERASQRVAAVGTLKSFLDPRTDDRNTRVIVSVANAIALEDDQVASNAMVTFFSELNPDVVDLNSQSSALQTIVANDRGILRDKLLWLEEPGNWYSYMGEDAKGRKLEAMMLSMVSLLKNGARVKDMSDVYLATADLSGLDLSEIIFDDSILSWANLSNSVLAGASFNGANLDRTDFTSSDMRKVRIDITGGLGGKYRRFSFVKRHFGEDRQINLPILSCADLRQAHLSGFPLWDVTPDSVRGGSIGVSAPSFAGANMEGATLDNVSVFFRTKLDSNEATLLEFTSAKSRRNKDSSNWLGIAELDSDTLVVGDPTDFRQALADIRNRFDRSNLSGAKLPLLIQRYGASTTRNPKGSLWCKPRAPWW